MKYFFVALFILPFVFVSCNSNAQAGVDTKVVNVSAKQAKSLIEKGPVQILDIRTPGEFAQGHIAGAININFNSPNFEQELSKLDKNKEYLVHCRSGHRSGNALRTFKKLGFKHIDHMNHGIIDWNNAGYPLTR